MDISSIHFHDTRILRVMEDCVNNTLTMEVVYPTDWEHNVFERRWLVFEDVYGYKTFDGPFQGEPTILGAEIVGTEGRWSTLRLDTNAGYRELSCRGVRLCSHAGLTDKGAPGEAGTVRRSDTDGEARKV